VAEQPPHVMIIDLPRQSQRRTWPRSVRAQWGSSVETTKAVRGNGKALAHYKKWLGCNEPRFSSRMSCPFLNASYTKSEFRNVTTSKKKSF